MSGALPVGSGSRAATTNETGLTAGASSRRRRPLTIAMAGGHRPRWGPRDAWGRRAARPLHQWGFETISSTPPSSRRRSEKTVGFMSSQSFTP